MKSNPMEIELSSVITDIAAGPFGSNLKVECFVPEGFPIIDGANLKGFTVTDNVTKFVTEEKAYSLERSIAHRGDVVSTISGTLGQIAYIPNDSKYEGYLCSQRQFRITFDEKKVYTPYIVFYFHTREGQHKILSFASQVGVPALSQPLKNFRKIKICLPDIETQKRIASVIEALNNKIETNQKINGNLLHQALCLFAEEYVKKADVDSELPLYDFADYINGAAFKPDELGNTGLPVIKIAELKAGITGSTQFFSGNKGEKYLVHNKDILFSWSGNPETSIDIFVWAEGDGILNQHTFNVKSKYSCPWFTFLLLKNNKTAFTHIASNKQTTGLGHVTVADLRRLTFPFDIDRMTIFEKMVTPIMDLFYYNLLENQKLSVLRDSLLPKLMSGELDVSALEL